MSEKAGKAEKNPLANYKPVYVVEEKTEDGRLIARGTLKHGMKIGAVVHKDFEMVGAMTSDMFDAESETPTLQVLQFNGQMICRQLRSIGSFQGPFTIDMIGRLKPGDYNKLRQAQTELDILGEAE